MKQAPRRRSPALKLLLAVCAVFLFCGFSALGTWQVWRLNWKLQLMQQVEQRVHAPPVTAPELSSWPQVNASEHAYRHVSLRGTYLYQASVKVQAVTELGPGFWLLTPMCRSDGTLVLVNRGFIEGKADAPLVPAAAAACPAPGAPQVELTGLLRISEPGGGFLRNNDAGANRWYSRDVAAIASARGLSRTAPYFVDADAGPQVAGADGQSPVGGLTVIVFHNNHLAYALTWYALALMVAGAAWWVTRLGRRETKETSDDGKQD